MSTLTQPTALYDGYDSFLGERRDGAVSGGTSQPTDGAISSYVYVCTSSESVSSALSVSASISASGIDYSASAKATFTQQLNMTSTSVVVIVHTIYQIQTSAQSYNPTTQPADVQAFFTQYGDSFVDELVTGGEYYAAFVYNSTTTSEQESITASLKGAVSTGATSLSMSVSTDIDNAASSNNVTYTISQNVYGATGVSLPTDSSGIITFSNNFSQHVNAPEVLGYHVTGYERGGVTGLTAVIANRNLFGTDTTPADVASTLSTLASTADTIQAMYSGYQYTGDSGFAAKCNQINADLSTIDALIQEIENEVTGQNTAPSLPSLSYGTPVASYLVKPPVSSAAGRFYDLSTSQIASGVAPSQISLTAGGFQVIYSDGTVASHNAVGKSAGTLSIAGTDSIAKVEFATDLSNVTCIVTANGVSVGDSPPAYALSKAPPTIIGFTGNTATAESGPGGYGVITISISPAVWGRSPAAP